MTSRYFVKKSASRTQTTNDKPLFFNKIRKTNRAWKLKILTPWFDPLERRGIVDLGGVATRDGVQLVLKSWVKNFPKIIITRAPDLRWRWKVVHSIAFFTTDRMVTVLNSETSKITMKKVGPDKKKSGPTKKIGPEKNENPNTMFWPFRTTGHSRFGMGSHRRWSPTRLKKVSYKQKTVFAHEQFSKNRHYSVSRPSPGMIQGAK